MIKRIGSITRALLAVSAGIANVFTGAVIGSNISYAVPISCTTISDETLAAVGGVPVVGKRQEKTTSRGDHVCIWQSAEKGIFQISIAPLPPEGRLIRGYLTHPATWLGRGCQITSVTDDNQTIAIQGYTCDQVTKINAYLQQLSKHK